MRRRLQSPPFIRQTPPLAAARSSPLLVRRLPPSVLGPLNHGALLPYLGNIVSDTLPLVPHQQNLAFRDASYVRVAGIQARDSCRLRPQNCALTSLPTQAHIVVAGPFICSGCAILQTGGISRLRRNFIEPVHQKGGFRLPHRTRCEP